MRKPTILLVAPYRGHRILYEHILSERYHILIADRLPPPDSILLKRALGVLIINQWEPIDDYLVVDFAETTKLPVIITADRGYTYHSHPLLHHPDITLITSSVSSERLFSVLEKVISQTTSQQSKLLEKPVCKSLKSAYKSPIFRRKIETVIEYINTHYDEIDNFRDIADRFDLNYSSMRTAIKQKTAKFPREYLQTVRVESILKLIQFTQLSIEEICIEVGFHDTAYAQKLFKKMYKTHIKECIVKLRQGY
jgi:AraC-like DNA-binding protein